MEAAGGRRFRAIIPAFLSVSLCLLRLLLSPDTQKQENGPREKQPPSDHAPVRGEDFEGNLSRTALAQLRAASCRGPELRGAARRGAIVYVFLGRPADRGLVFAERAQV